MSKQYNGYASYETFLIALNIDNDQGSQEYWASQAAMVRENEQQAIADGSSEGNVTVETLAGMLETEHLDAVDNLHLRGWLADMMSAAMCDVDWRDLAEHLLAD
jgi:hypothetical protein